MASDVRRLLDPRRHSFYQHGKAAFFLSFDEQGQVVGRLAVLNNDNYNEYNHEKTAFFYLFECINSAPTACDLFSKAVEWTQQQGLNKIVGPKGFTALDGIGMLVKGFDHRPAFGIPYNLPYYPSLVEAVGFVNAGETVSGYLDSSFRIPPKVNEVARLVKERRGMKVVRLQNRRELKKIIPSLQALYNLAIEETTGNIPLTQDDVKTMASQMLWFANPKLIKIIMKDNQPVGFLLAYPDISAAVQRCHGRLFPFGWIDLLLEIKRTQWININGAGIIEKYRGLGGTALLFSELTKSITESDYKYADLVQIGIENEKMQLELRDMGIDFYKVHRNYEMFL